jgi:hypothetical protein
VCIYIYIYTYIYIYIYIYTIKKQLNINTWSERTAEPGIQDTAYTYIMHTFKYTYTYVYIYIYTYIRIYIYIYIYIHIHQIETTEYKYLEWKNSRAKDTGYCMSLLLWKLSNCKMCKTFINKYTYIWILVYKNIHLLYIYGILHVSSTLKTLQLLWWR